MNDRRCAPAWLAALEVGDLVAVMGSRYGAQLDRVERITRTQIVLRQHGRFLRASGAEVGRRTYDSLWSLAEATPEVEAAITRHRVRESCAREHDLTHATDAELDALYAIFQAIAGRGQP